MPYVDLPSGTNLFYQYHRGGRAVNDLDPNKPTVLLLHSQFTSSEAWTVLMRDARLAHACNFVTIDEKFHGNSTGPLEPGRTYGHAASDAVHMMLKLDLSPCHVVGESHSGARTAIHIALLRPDLCKSIMLISPGVVDEECEATTEAVIQLRDMLRETNLQNERESKTADYSRELLQGYVGYYYSNTISADIAEQEMERFNRRYAREPTDQLMEVFETYFAKRKIPNLDQIKQPVMIIEGSRNESYSMEVAGEAWVDAFPNSALNELHFIHGAPMNVTAMYPNMVARYLAGWLSKTCNNK